jgi:ribosomal protein S18 acetylase RimI-like enzyme/anti-sigma regulatory factor (Ser/Thr protein kinase)
MAGDVLTVRAAHGGEADAVGSVLTAAYAEHVAAFPADMATSYLAEVLDVAGRLQDPAYEVLVATDADRVVGTVTFLGDAGADGHPWPPGGSVVRLLAVDPSVRGRGIGRMLLDACVHRARRRGSGYVGLHTAPFMGAARALYQSTGFERAPEHDFDPHRYYSPSAAFRGADAVASVQGCAYVLPLRPQPLPGRSATWSLPAGPAVARAARGAVHEALAEDDVDVEVVALCASELATNALLHGDPPIQLELSVADGFVRVAVHDAGSGTVSLREAGADPTAQGRGLSLVAAVSERWGVQPTAIGKTVWCDIASRIRSDAADGGGS